MRNHGSPGSKTPVIVNERGQMKAHNESKYAISPRLGFPERRWTLAQIAGHSSRAVPSILHSSL
jgi:hypothetical protein